MAGIDRDVAIGTAIVEAILRSLPDAQTQLWRSPIAAALALYWAAKSESESFH